MEQELIAFKKTIDKYSEQQLMTEFKKTHIEKLLAIQKCKMVFDKLKQKVGETISDSSDSDDSDN